MNLLPFPLSIIINCRIVSLGVLLGPEKSPYRVVRLRSPYFLGRKETCLRHDAGRAS